MTETSRKLKEHPGLMQVAKHSTQETVKENSDTLKMTVLYKQDDGDGVVSVGNVFDHKSTSSGLTRGYSTATY